MQEGDWVAVSALSIAIVLLAIGMWHDRKVDKIKAAEKAERKRDLEKLLSLEMEKPKWRIVFRTVHQVDYALNFIDPVAQDAMGNRVVSSKELAMRCMMKFMEKGFISDKDSVTFPLHMIDRVWIESDEKN